MEAGCQGEGTVSGEAGGSLPGCDRSEGRKGDRIIIISGNSSAKRTTKCEVPEIGS